MVLNENQRRLRRSKQSERDFGRYLLEHDGPCPIYSRIASSTGRVGQITDLQFDVVSLHFAGENKLVKVPKKILNWWDQIVEVASRHGKEPLLRVVPTNEGKHTTLMVITEDKLADLLDKEARLEDLMR